MLVVCLDGQRAGYLETAGSRVRFWYDEAWLAAPDAYPLSAALPLQPLPATGRIVLNVLWGLLPDNDRTLEAWGRRFQVSPRNPVALLAHVGQDCAGAVQFVTQDQLADVLGANTAAVTVDWLDKSDFEKRIQQLARDGAAGRATVEEGQFSLSGAQAKTALYFDARRKRWGVPRGRTPTTHILKPASNEFDGFAENEHFCLTLARSLGLAAARTQWHVIGGVPTLVSERYDRARIDGQWRRVHQEDACQALGIHPESKYENQGGPGFLQLMSLMNGADDAEADRARLMQTACFTYLVAATDAHAKNYSLLHGRGHGRPSMRLAPLYDMASAWPYPKKIPPKKMKLAMKVGGHYRIDEILPRHFRELARRCGFPQDRITEMLSQWVEELPDMASVVAKQVIEQGMERRVVEGITAGITRHCARVKRAFTLG